MRTNQTNTNDYGLTLEQWSQVWDIVRFITKGDFAEEGEFADVAPGEVPDAFDDVALTVDPTRFNQTDLPCHGVCIRVENIDRAVLEQFDDIAQRLGLSTLAIADLPQDSGSCQTDSYMASDRLGLDLNGTCPDYCDDEADAQMVLTFDFREPEVREQFSESATDGINESVLSTLRANIGAMPKVQRVRLAPTLREVVDQLLDDAA